MYYRVSSRLFIFEEFERFRAEPVHAVANRSARQNGHQYAIDMPIGNSPPQSPDDGALGDLRAAAPGGVAAEQGTVRGTVGWPSGFSTIAAADRRTPQTPLRITFTWIALLPDPVAARARRRRTGCHWRIRLSRGHTLDVRAGACETGSGLEQIPRLSTTRLRRSSSWWSNLA